MWEKVEKIRSNLIFRDIFKFKNNLIFKDEKYNVCKRQTPRNQVSFLAKSWK